jgi:hypothetical protein
VFAAAVIGGVSLDGGKGTLFGALCGVIVLGLIQNILVFAGVAGGMESGDQRRDHHPGARPFPADQRQGAGLGESARPCSAARDRPSGYSAVRGRVRVNYLDRGHVPLVSAVWQAHR